MIAEFGWAIFLEDDLEVSPHFYEYTIEAIEFYQSENIAGISLYSYAIAESSFQPFHAVEDGMDNYFMQFPSSWGQCFAAEQWDGFEDFISENTFSKVTYPAFVNAWKSESWKKDFLGYMLHNDSYFVYPRMSLTSSTINS